MSGLSGQCPLVDLLECVDLARSSYHYALSRPKAPTSPELWGPPRYSRAPPTGAATGRSSFACDPSGARIADKTALKMVREMGISCGIRRETDYHGYDSCRGKVGKAFENVISRDLGTDGPWEKMGTDVTGFKRPWGRPTSRRSAI